MTILVLILLLGAVFLYFLFSKWGEKVGISNLQVAFGFLIKFLAGCIFLYIYLYADPVKEMDNDAETFLVEGEMLNHLYFESPDDYFRLLIGLDSDSPEVERFKSATGHWNAGDQSLINDNKNIIRIHSLLYFFSFGSPFVHLVFFVLAGYIGILLIVRFLRNYSSISSLWLLGIYVLFPSITFWSSSILKEPILILGLGIFLTGMLPNKELFLLKRIGFFFVGIILLVGFKPYVVLTLLPALLFYLIYTRTGKYRWTSLGGALLVILALGTFFQSSIERLTHSIARKQFDFSNIGRGGLYADADSTFYYFRHDQYNKLHFAGDSISLKEDLDVLIAKYGSIEEPIPIRLKADGAKWRIHFQNAPATSFIEIPQIRTPNDLIKTAPGAITNTLLRPYPWDPGNELKYVNFLESIGLLALFLFGWTHWKNLSIQQKGLVLAVLIFIISLSLIIGWVTPVLGAIVRYRIPIQLAMIGAIVIFFYPKKNTQHE